MSKDVIETYNSDNILDSIPELEAKKIEIKMLLAAKIDNAIKAKGWKNKDLLAAVGKDSPSVATKWLSGTHNFTVDTLVELAGALNITLLDVFEKRESNTVRFHIEVSASAAEAPRLDFSRFLKPVYSVRHSSFPEDSHSHRRRIEFLKA